MASNVLDTIDQLKNQLDALRPLPPDVAAHLEQKLRIESNYHSNALEGNSLTLGETRSLLLSGRTARGKMRDHLDIQGHDDAVMAIERAATEGDKLTGVFIRNLHRVLLKEPYETESLTPDNRRTMRTVALGDYKTTPNNVKTLTGEIYHFTPPEQVKPKMTDLLDWYRDQESTGEHPIIIAATFHWRFVRIHPFDDGNGRMARLLMNLILLKHGYPLAIVDSDNKERYLSELERVDQTEDLAAFIEFIASCCTYALDLYLRAARGDPIEDPGDIDHEIAVFKRSISQAASAGDRVALRQHVETVAHPFYIYCNSNIESLSSGVFTSPLRSHMRVRGTDTQGSSFSVISGIELRLLYGREADLGGLSDFASAATIEFRFALRGFQNTDRSVEISITNLLSPSEYRWTFRVTGDGHDSVHPGEYDGRNQDELRKRFDDLLRYIIELMRQWRAESSPIVAGCERSIRRDPTGACRPRRNVGGPPCDRIRAWIRKRWR